MVADTAEMGVALAGGNGLPTEVAARNLHTTDADSAAAAKDVAVGVAVGVEGRLLTCLHRVCDGLCFNPVHLADLVSPVHIDLRVCTKFAGFARCTGLNPAYAESVPNLAELLFRVTAWPSASRSCRGDL